MLEQIFRERYEAGNDAGTPVVVRSRGRRLPWGQLRVDAGGFQPVDDPLGALEGLAAMGSLTSRA